MSSLLRKGAVALVTGGANGLGRGAVERLAARGAIVYSVDLPQSVNGLDSQKGLSNDLIQNRAADVTSESDITAVIEEIKSKHGRLDLLANVAGIFQGDFVYNARKKQPISMDIFHEVFKVNVFGTINVIRLAAGLMAENKPNEDGQRGVIINVTSVFRKDAPVTFVAYGGSKAAIAGMTMPLARELSPLGIRVVAIAPGAFGTQMVLSHPGVGEASVQAILFPKRLGVPEEFGSIVEFVADHPLVNATILEVDGGLRIPNPAQSNLKM